MSMTDQEKRDIYRGVFFRHVLSPLPEATSSSRVGRPPAGASDPIFRQIANNLKDMGKLFEAETVLRHGPNLSLRTFVMICGDFAPEALRGAAQAHTVAHDYEFV